MRLKMSHLLSVDHSTPPIVQPFASAMFAASTKSDTRIFATGAPMPTVRLPFSQRPSAHVRECRAGLSLHSYVLSLSSRGEPEQPGYCLSLRGAVKRTKESKKKM